AAPGHGTVRFCFGSGWARRGLPRALVVNERLRHLAADLVQHPQLAGKVQHGEAAAQLLRGRQPGLYALKADAELPGVTGRSSTGEKGRGVVWIHQVGLDRLGRGLEVPGRERAGTVRGAPPARLLL